MLNNCEYSVSKGRLARNGSMRTPIQPARSPSRLGPQREDVRDRVRVVVAHRLVRCEQSKTFQGAHAPVPYALAAVPNHTAAHGSCKNEFFGPFLGC